ncbi:hypothetical protein [Sulfitobacter sp.]|uniref:hypothetical protein n=1 Tax=Sulfitobacter sp. TaxID=1903071 RepID=UPI00272B0F55|nr:hypothetical protein [Sulfitobacter sp.]
MRRFNPYKAVGLVLTFGLPFIPVYFGMGEALRVSEKPSEYIGVVFSILAASLFAIVSIVGDPSMLLPGTWRASWEQAKDVQLRLMRLTYLFVLYLLVLALLVTSEIIEAKSLEDWYFVHDVFGYMALVAFMLSIWLPFEIRNIQIERLRQEIEARRKKKN